MNSELSHVSCIFIIFPKISYFIEHTREEWPFTPKLNKIKVKENTAWWVFFFLFIYHFYEKLPPSGLNNDLSDPPALLYASSGVSLQMLDAGSEHSSY